MKKVAVIGGSYLQLPLVKRAKELGIETHCFSWQDGAVCEKESDFFYPISIIEKELILEECRRIGIDGITSIASDVAVITVNYVAHHLGLLCNPYQYTGITTNKYQMRRRFMECGIPSPRFALAGVQDLPNLSEFRYPLIVKPTDRSGSLGVEMIEKPCQLEHAIARACGNSFEQKAIVEEFVPGREISVESISFDGRHHILQITDKVTTGHPFFVELEHHQPSSLPQPVQQKVEAIVLRALDALHITYGASHSELKITPEGDIRVIEIGARMGGDFIGSDLVKLSTGYDFVQGVIEVALGSFRPPVLSAPAYAGVYFLSQETAALRPYILHPEQVPEIVAAAITDPQLRSVQCSAQRSGYLIYQSKTGKLQLP